MKQKYNKKYLKTNFISFIIALIIFGSIGVYAAITFPSNDVSYDNSVSGLKSTSVKDAIDELYTECTKELTAGEQITELLPDNLDELYKDNKGNIRYYGKNPNNYVSFNNELWRIIGVIDGKIKIIRNESIGNKKWSSNGRNSWNNSDLQNYLNNEYYNGIKPPYKEMISEEKFYLGGPAGGDGDQSTASQYYDKERSGRVYMGNPVSTKQYIGLMYPSDYGYAAEQNCLEIQVYEYDKICYKNDYLYSGNNEWLQTPLSSHSAAAAYLTQTGTIYANASIDEIYAIRPVLYLSSSVKITGGTGSQSDPYTIE